MAIIFSETGQPITTTNPFPVTGEVVSVVGETITIATVVFNVDGRVLYGLAAARPTAAAAHAALPFAYYNAVDTQALTQTDGTNWESVEPKTVSVEGSTAQLGSERLTSLATATAMTPTAGATSARAYVEAGEVRVTDTGTAATTTTGILIGAGVWETIWNPDEGSIIETVASSVVTVVYY